MQRPLAQIGSNSNGVEVHKLSPFANVSSLPSLLFSLPTSLAWCKIVSVDAKVGAEVLQLRVLLARRTRLCRQIPPTNFIPPRNRIFSFRNLEFFSFCPTGVSAVHGP
jgi:hypothetical protein